MLGLTFLGPIYKAFVYYHIIISRTLKNRQNIKVLIVKVAVSFESGLMTKEVWGRRGSGMPIKSNYSLSASAVNMLWKFHKTASLNSSFFYILYNAL